MDLTRCSTVIVFGGSFDPPHLAHVRLPQLARAAIGADAVIYLPAAVSPFKAGQETTPAAHRLAMLRLALADQPLAVVRTDEIDRAADGKPSYTIDTLRALRKELGGGVTLRLLIGADQLRAFDRWRDWQSIVTIAEPLVMARPPLSATMLLDRLPDGFDADAWRSRIIELPLMEISSTEIRARLAADADVSNALPPRVIEYIREHGLYRDDA